MIATRVDGTGYILQGAKRANYTASSNFHHTYTHNFYDGCWPCEVKPYLSHSNWGQPLGHSSHATYGILKLDDWTLHSLPFGYFFIDLWSTDGNNHSVQLYSDMSGGEYMSRYSTGFVNSLKCVEFVSPYPQDRLSWNTTVTSTLVWCVYKRGKRWPSSRWHSVFCLPSSEWVCWFIPFMNFIDIMCTQIPKVALTWQSCYSEVCRDNFAEVGRLENTTDTNSRTINDTLPVMAFALDMGNITQSENHLVFAIGLFRTTIIWYDPTGGGYPSTYEQIPLWRNRWSNIWDAVRSGPLVPVRTHVDCCLE